MGRYRARMDAFDRRLRAEAPSQGIAILMLLAFAVILIHLLSVSFMSGDFILDIGVWQRKLHEYGLAGLGRDFYNYNPPYIYLLYLGTLLPIPDLTMVKIISLLFDLLLAVGVARVVTHARGNLYLGVLAGLVILLVPEVWLNSALWGQVDAGYTAALIWMLGSFLQRKDVAGWVWFAIAFALKAQAVFLLPLVILLFILQHHRLRAPLLAALTLLLLDVPARIAGRSVQSLLSIYFDQADTFHQLSLHAPNLYLLINNNLYDVVRPLGLLFGAVVTIGLFLLLLITAKRGRIDISQTAVILGLSLLFAILIPYTLPQMHERYFYTAGVLAVMLIFFDRRFLAVAILVQLADFFAYAPFLFGTVVGQFPYIPKIDWVAYAGIPFETLAVLITLRLVLGRRAEIIPIGRKFKRATDF